jgi:hypothetical protein
MVNHALRRLGDVLVRQGADDLALNISDLAVFCLGVSIFFTRTVDFRLPCRHTAMWRRKVSAYPPMNPYMAH